jgi:hypothetical protein
VIRRRAAALAAAGLALLLVLVVAPPARADAIRGGITSPDEGATLATSTPRIAASFAHSEGTIDNVVLEAVSERGGDRQTRSEPGNGRSSVAVEWNPQLAYNGRYTVTATANGSHPAPLVGDAEPPVSAQATRTFFLAAPPAVPGEVTAEESGDNIVVRWKANTEPDLVGYQIERSSARSTAFRAVGISTGTRFTDDTISDPGRYVYRVIAVRQGAQDEGVASEPSAASRAVEVDDPPATTTTTVAGSGDGDSDGAGSGSGTATTTASGSGSQSSPPVRRSGTVDLSGFRTLLDQNTTTPVVPGETDPGFQQTLPFDAEADEGSGESEDEPQIEVGLGEPLDPGEDADAARQKSLSFIAGGLLLFVLLMGTLFVRSEVNRGDQLGMDAVPVEQP